MYNRAQPLDVIGSGKGYIEYFLKVNIFEFEKSIKYLRKHFKVNYIIIL